MTRGYNAAIEKAERDKNFERVVGQVVYGVCLLLFGVFMGLSVLLVSLALLNQIVW